MKTCFKCGETKGLSEFYRHPNASQGCLNKCKECTKIDVRANRAKRIEYYREYDRGRGNRQRNPNKTRAQNMVNNAVRDGRLHKGPCEICGSVYRIHGHHDDYAKPLNVRWLCAAHHKEWHTRNGEGING